MEDIIRGLEIRMFRIGCHDPINLVENNDQGMSYNLWCGHFSENKWKYEH